MIYTHHPRSCFERRMHQRRERQAQRARERKQTFPSLRQSTGYRTARRRMRQDWKYYVVHGVAHWPELMD